MRGRHATWPQDKRVLEADPTCQVTVPPIDPRAGRDHSIRINGGTHPQAWRMGATQDMCTDSWDVRVTAGQREMGGHMAWGPSASGPDKRTVNTILNKRTQVPSKGVCPYLVSRSPLPTQSCGDSFHPIPCWAQYPGHCGVQMVSRCEGQGHGCRGSGEPQGWGFSRRAGAWDRGTAGVRVQGPGANLKVYGRRPHLSPSAPGAHWAQTSWTLYGRSRNNSWVK